MKSLKKQIFFLHLLISGLCLLASCKTAFTYSLRLDMENSKIEINKIQFFNSEKIELKRTLRQDEKMVHDGEYKSIKGKTIEYIIIPCKTPGVFVQNLKNINSKDDKTKIKDKAKSEKDNPEKNQLLISFDSEDINRWLPFKLKNGKYYLDVSDKGEIKYNANIYSVTEGINSYLMIQESQKKYNKKYKKKLKGRVLENQ